MKALSRLIPQSPAQAPATSHRARVLYVEDDQLNWEILSWLLHDQFELVRATHAAQAFELLRSQHFDMALMDVQLSGSELNGFDIARLLHGTYDGHVPPYAKDLQAAPMRIIFLTASEGVFNDQELQALGAEAVLRKPIELHELLATLSGPPKTVSAA